MARASVSLPVRCAHFPGGIQSLTVWKILRAGGLHSGDRHGSGPWMRGEQERVQRWGKVTRAAPGVSRLSPALCFLTRPSYPERRAAAEAAPARGGRRRAWARGPAGRQERAARRERRGPQAARARPGTLCERAEWSRAVCARARED